MRPTREKIDSVGRTYFVTSQTAQRRPLFRTERLALLLEDVFCSYSDKSYTLHAYVIMPDHFHVLLSPLESLERAMQKIKGGFSFRAKKELGSSGEMWQPGFSDHRIRDLEGWHKHKEYIRRNPAKAGLCFAPDAYGYIKLELAPLPQWLKPHAASVSIGGSEAPPLQNTGNLSFQRTHDMQNRAGRMSEGKGLNTKQAEMVEENRLECQVD